MKAKGGVDVQLYSILTLAQDGGEQPASGHGRFTTKKGPDTNLIDSCWFSEPVWLMCMTYSKRKLA